MQAIGGGFCGWVVRFFFFLGGSFGIAMPEKSFLRKIITIKKEGLQVIVIRVSNWPKY